MFRSIIVVILLIFLSITVNADDNYFYNLEGKINLYPVDNKVVVGFKSIFGNHFEDFYFIYPELTDTIMPEKVQGTFYIYEAISPNSIDSLISAMNNDTEIIWAHHVYAMANGGEYAYTDQIAIQKRASLSQGKYDSLLEYYNLEEVGGCRSNLSIKYLKLLDNSKCTLLETANRLHENPDIEFSNPRFFKHNFKPFYEPSDPLYTYQWNYKNNYYYYDDDEVKGVDISMEKAWDITRGSDNITIAVIDDGFSEHHDFRNGSIIKTIDYIGETVDSPVVDYDCTHPTADSLGHGYACSGLILAEHNDTGIAGIAPECELIFIKVVDDNDNWAGPEEMGGALIRAAQEGANVISCSWGDHTGTGWPAVTKALDTITNPAYMGYSCAVFFASGNSSSWHVASPANLPTTLAVGATDSIDTKWWYSQYSGSEIADSTLDVMAPSGNVPHWIDIYWPLDSALVGSIVTMDRPGDWGYNTYNYEPPYLPYSFIAAPPWFLIGDSLGMEYFGGFGGTSAACPQVAGIAALVMSRKPALKDSNYVVYDIIRNSSRDQVGPSTGYQPDTPGWDPYYGYGRVDAYRALLSVIRGDVNNDGTLNLLDITDLIAALYNTGDPPAPDWRVGDANCNGVVNILDVTFLTAYLYKGGSEPQNCFIYDYVQFPDL